MIAQPRHLIQAAILHAILFFFLLVGVQCSERVETPPVVQGVLIDPNDLKNLKPPTPPTPQAKPDEVDQGPQKIVNDTQVVADTAKQKQEAAAAAEQKKLEDQQKAEQQKQAEAKAAEEQKQKEEQAKAEELKQQQEAQKAAEQAAAAKKQQEEEARQKAAAAAAEAQRKKEEELRQAAQKEQEAQAAALAKQKKAEDAQRAAEQRKRAEELQKSLGAESAELTAEVQNQWILQLIAAIQDKWAWPPGTDRNTKATLKLRLAPTGAVLSADISVTSGQPLFDQSLRQAAYNASPLPLPKDLSAFDPNLNICFSPNPRSCSQ